MEMEESEGHISIQIASILSAIHLAWLGWAVAVFLVWLHLHIFIDFTTACKILCVLFSLVVPGTSIPCFPISLKHNLLSFYS